MAMISGFKELLIEDYSLIRQYQEDMLISDMGFTQLFAWQSRFQNQYKIINNYLCILYLRDNGEYSCYAPLGQYKKESYNKTLLELKSIFDKLKIPFRFDFVPEDWLVRFGKLDGYEVSMSCNDDFSDYLYKTEDFLDLKGKNNEQKRYLVNYFTKHYSYQYQRLTKNNLSDACKVVEKWCEGRDCRQCYWGCEKIAIFRILRNWDFFDCKGALIYINGEPKAFMVGEKIRYDVVVSHFQKADKAIKGLYTFLSNQFYWKEYPDIPYINLQEDMGIPGIRESKLAYKPYKMIRKYTVALKEL